MTGFRTICATVSFRSSVACKIDRTNMPSSITSQSNLRNLRLELYVWFPRINSDTNEDISCPALVSKETSDGSPPSSSWRTSRYWCPGSDEKLAFCKKLGADVCINYKTEDFVARVKEETGGKGMFRVNVILDCVGAPYFQQNLDSLDFDGRLFIIGTQGGAKTELNIGSLCTRRPRTVQAAGLRSRSLENKAEIVSEVEKYVWSAITAGEVKPVIHKYFPLSEAPKAHQLMESSQHIGKIMLVP
ncbi:hypothetical protein EZV62_026607 [Acer yangbiense]|uniref:Enoyl reductase (ER) domain-containing protein n=1 Tax=Acer yangbiense TaxID=1000413 RepID=A0A5C7GRR3_9ROSI|nr:hypothetical protein EZV62_026607 [Acer yangbiense]